MKLKVRYRPQEGYTPLIRRGKTGMEHLELGVLQMSSVQDFRGRTGEDEMLLVLLRGMVHLEARGKRWEFLGGRKNVFEGRATAAYLPRRTAFKLTSLGESEIAFCRARSREEGEPYLVSADEVRVSQRGEAGFQREIHELLPLDWPASRLIVGETFNFPGQWSSYPPHKHDQERPPVESKMEEIYLYQIDPPQGFGLQRIYSPEVGLDEALVITNNLAVGLPAGYHPVVAAPGYRLYYLWLLAGESRQLIPYDDPDHAWVKRGVAI
ncbi:MAG: 5-deoxy-glucuronate isomerase [candidate division NC10 bacterium]|nr:5-deoxy-glucuronate isomerase [candidate division NC10 bacterium]